MNLYQIESDLQQLVDMREVAGSEGDSIQLAVIDQQIREYLTREAAKVTSYVALIRAQEDLDAACAREMSRVREIRERAIALRRKLEANALAVMQQFGVRELKATPGGGLRVQTNGGKQALEVELHIVPQEHTVCTVAMPFVMWRWIRELIGMPGQKSTREQIAACRVMEDAVVTADTERIREALARGEQITGAKLLPRGEHLRVL